MKALNYWRNRDMAVREISNFTYRTGMAFDVELNINTTPLDRIVAGHTIDLDDAEEYIVNMVQHSPEYRKIIADRLRELADEVENTPFPTIVMNGYIIDYDGYDVDDEICDIHEIDWSEAELEMLKKREEHKLTYDID